MSACVAGSNAVVTLSLGSRPFVQITRPLMSAYAARIGAAFHIVDKHDHESLQLPAALDKTKTAAQTSRFMKVQVLMYFLKKHARILYLDDDTIVGPATPDLFAAVPCGTLGASVEWHKPPAWHTMHWRSACDIYEILFGQHRASRSAGASGIQGSCSSRAHHTCVCLSVAGSVTSIV